MNDEDMLDSVLEIDKVLSEIEFAMESKDYKLARTKINEAREVINELKQDDDDKDTAEIEMNIMRKLK